MNKFFVFALLALSACAHSVADAGPDLAAAYKKCTSQTWSNAVALVSCQDSEERPVIKRDAPVLLQAFDNFLSKRKLLAKKFDDENAPALEARGQLDQELKEATAILAVHEPQFKDKDSILMKEMASANPDKVCTSQIFVERAKCYDSIQHPVWERDAPDTIHYYDDFQKVRLQLSKKYDAGGAKIMALANEHFAAGMKEVRDEFSSQGRQAIQQQQESEAQASAESAQNRAQLLSLVGELGKDFLSGIAMSSQARASTAPAVATIAPELPQMSHTSCQMVFDQWQCTTTSY